MDPATYGQKHNVEHVTAAHDGPEPEAPMVHPLVMDLGTPRTPGDDEFVTRQPAAAHGTTTARALRRAAGALRSQVRKHESVVDDGARYTEHKHHRASAADLGDLAATLAAGAPWSVTDDAECVVWVLTPEDRADVLDALRRAAAVETAWVRQADVLTDEETTEAGDAAARLRALVGRLDATSGTEG